MCHRYVCHRSKCLESYSFKRTVQNYSFNHTVQHSFRLAPLMLCICLVIGASLSVMNASRRYLPLPLSRRSMFSLLCCLYHVTPSPSTELRRQSRRAYISARDAGSLTSRVNGSVMVRLVVSIQAILDPLQGN